MGLPQDVKPKPKLPEGWPPKLVADTQAKNRLWMVRTQIMERGISQKGVLDSMRAVPRHLFVPVSQRRWAYADRPLAIGYDQTISQPYMVASMTEELKRLSARYTEMAVRTF